MPDQASRLAVHESSLATESSLEEYMVGAALKLTLRYSSRISNISIHTNVHSADYIWIPK